MVRIFCVSVLFFCLVVATSINAQVINLSNFNVPLNSYYKKDKIGKSKLVSNEYNFSGLAKNINLVPSSLDTYTIKLDEENRDAIFECEGNLMSLWRQYQKSCLEKKIKINYQQLYDFWQSKDKFCSDLLDKIALKMFFNFVAPNNTTFYLQKIIVQKLAYPGNRGNDVLSDWMSGFQHENGFQLIVIKPSLVNDTITLDKPLIIEKQGTLNVNFSSMHYQYLPPGSLQQDNYIIKLKFLFINNAKNEYLVNTPVFLVRI